jgi:hypothetical protein
MMFESNPKNESSYPHFLEQTRFLAWFQPPDAISDR